MQRVERRADAGRPSPTPTPASVELGVKFTSDTDGQITGARFYKGPINTGTHTATLWSAAGTQLATGTFTGESATGWQTVTFASPVAVTAGTTYVVSYHTTRGGFSYQRRGIRHRRGRQRRRCTCRPTPGCTSTARCASRPTASDANYWVDPVFSHRAPADTTPPTVTAVTATGRGTTRTVTWTTNEAATSRVDYGTTRRRADLERDLGRVERPRTRRR